MEGGTGSESKIISQPFMLPDRFESGTINVAGIVGLSKGIEYVINQTPEEILECENNLIRRLVNNLSTISSVRLIGYNPNKRRSGVISIVIDGVDSLMAATILNIEYGIAVRAGFHCAYIAHSTLGTENTGTIRLSPGVFTDISEIDRASLAIREIALQNGK